MKVHKIRYNFDRYSCSVSLMLSLATVFPSMNNSPTIDEPFTVNLGNLPWVEMFRMFLRDPSASAYYVLLKLWFTILWGSEQALRSLSAILFGLTVLAVGMTAEKLRRVLASMSNIGIIFAGTARRYAIIHLCPAYSML